MKEKMYDVIIIGGSYAGLSAAMSLGRSLRDTLVIDGDNPCNKHTPHSHNFLTRDGETPQALHSKALEQVLNYKTVEFMSGYATGVSRSSSGYTIQTEHGESYNARKLIFATGVKDILLPIQGFEACWGISILHCPYCHGYEVRGKRTGIFASGNGGFGFSKIISNWTSDIVLFTNGPAELTAEQTEILNRKKVDVIEMPVASIAHEIGYVQHVILENGDKVPVSALYYSPECVQQSDLPKELGCELNEHGLIQVDLFQKTSVSGVYAAGDNSSTGRSVSGAVASGSLAGMMLNKELIEEEVEEIL